MSEAAVGKAFRAAVALLARSADAIVEKADADPRYDVSRAAVDLSAWEAMREPLEAFLGAAAAAILEPAPTAAKARDLAKQLAGEWAQTRAANLVVAAQRETRSVIRDVVADGIRTNRTVPAIARDIRSSIGLTPRDARSIARLRTRLAAEGLTAGIIEKRAAARAQALIRRRSDTIARTEVVAAKEQGKLAAWAVQVAEGKLPPDVMRKWVGRDPCDLCMTLDGSAPVPLGQPFPSPVGPVMAPPLHPRCKCRVVLVPASSTSKSVERRFAAMKLAPLRLAPVPLRAFARS